MQTLIVQADLYLPDGRLLSTGAELPPDSGLTQAQIVQMLDEKQLIESDRTSLYRLFPMFVGVDVAPIPLPDELRAFGLPETDE